MWCNVIKVRISVTHQTALRNLAEKKKVKKEKGNGKGKGKGKAEGAKSTEKQSIPLSSIHHACHNMFFFQY